jgi:4-hydroxybenzoate polyprenyltransferase
MDFRLSEFDFFLSCLVVICSTAAGNIINDYFDQKVDKINKPDRVIVGKSIKRRVAMALHQGLNVMSVLFCAVLCLRTGYWYPMIIPVVSATLLWWYSPYFKKRPFIGNIIVAMLVGIVPIWTGIFEMHELRLYYTDMLVDSQTFFHQMELWLIAFSAFAFVLTLAREAQKDMEDMEGDITEGYRTLPISLGLSFTKSYTAVLLVAAIGGLIYCMQLVFLPYENYFIDWIAAGALIVVPCLMSILKTLSAKNKKGFSAASGWTKVAMAGGIAFAYFLHLYLMSI